MGSPRSLLEDRRRPIVRRALMELVPSACTDDRAAALAPTPPAAADPDPDPDPAPDPAAADLAAANDNDDEVASSKRSPAPLPLGADVSDAAGKNGWRLTGCALGFQMPSGELPNSPAAPIDHASSLP